VVHILDILPFPEVVHILDILPFSRSQVLHFLLKTRLKPALNPLQKALMHKSRNKPPGQE